MVKRRATKNVYALRFPNDGAALAGKRVATSAHEARVGVIDWGAELTEEVALKMLAGAAIVAREWAIREHADYWLIRYRSDA